MLLIHKFFGPQHPNSVQQRKYICGSRAMHHSQASSPISQLRRRSLPVSCPSQTQHSRLLLRMVSISPSHWRRLSSFCAACTMAGQQPSLATLQSCYGTGMHSCQLTQTCLHHPTCWPLACWCSLTRLAAQGRFLSLGSPPL